jgi:hypothetical protein
MRGIKIFASIFIFIIAASLIIGGIGAIATPAESGVLTGIIILVIGLASAWGGIVLCKNIASQRKAELETKQYAPPPIYKEADTQTNPFLAKLVKFNVVPKFGTTAVYTKLSGLIPENEEILFALEGMEGSQLIPIIITAKNVYLSAKGGLLGVNISTIPIQRISSVSAKGGGLGIFKTLFIAEGTVIHTVEKVAAADNVIAAINKAQSAASAPVAAQSAPVSQADELAKFKKLLDDGVLTQEEFDKKKARILGL